MKPQLVKKTLSKKLNHIKKVNIKLSGLINLVIFLFILFICVLLYSKFYDKTLETNNEITP
jgi:hypothetical protein